MQVSLPRAPIIFITTIIILLLNHYCYYYFYYSYCYDHHYYNYYEYILRKSAGTNGSPDGVCRGGRVAGAGQRGRRPS